MINNKIFIAGCFDLFHIGHLKLIKEAKKIAGIDGKVIIGINSDKSRYKYCGRYPIINEKDRKEILESIKGVDEVYIYNEVNPKELVRKIKPDIIVIGDEKNKRECLKHNLDKEGTYKIAHFIPILKRGGKKYSTTMIIDKIKHGK